VSEKRDSSRSPYVASRMYQVNVPQPGPNDGDPRGFQESIMIDDMSFPDCRSAAEHIASEIPEYDFGIHY